VAIQALTRVVGTGVALAVAVPVAGTKDKATYLGRNRERRATPLASFVDGRPCGRSRARP
jgi:hypothetical protein